MTSSPDRPRTRLLITDDDAYKQLATLVPAASAGTIDVFAAATRCAELIESHPGWTSTPVTAMICGHLGSLPEPALPDDLSLRPVRRLPGDDAPEAVPLQDAVALAILADRSIGQPPAMFVDYLQSLPTGFQLLAAVGADGAVRATSGWGVFGGDATVIFVNTDPGSRRRGIGLAMTAAALRAARSAGASRACLTSSGDGLSIYGRLGFEIVSEMTRFSGPS